jgi:hypothetical protein
MAKDTVAQPAAATQDVQIQLLQLQLAQALSELGERKKRENVVVPRDEPKGEEVVYADQYGQKKRAFLESIASHKVGLDDAGKQVANMEFATLAIEVRPGKWVSVSGVVHAGEQHRGRVTSMAYWHRQGERPSW